jgi:chromosome segregation ATPase
MSKNERGIPSEKSKSLESKIVIPSSSPTNAKDQLMKVRQQSSVLDKTISSAGEELEEQEFDSTAELEAQREEVGKKIDTAKHALENEAKKCAELMLAEWPDTEQVERSQSELKRINDELEPVTKRLAQLNRKHDKLDFPDFKSVAGWAYYLENLQVDLAGLRKRTEQTIKKADELKKLMAESNEMSTLSRMFSGINGKINTLKNSGYKGPIKDAESRLEDISHQEKLIREAEPQLQALRDEARQLEIRKTELMESRDTIKQPLDDLRKHSRELITTIRKIHDEQQPAGDDLTYNKSLLTKYLEKK